MKKIVTLALVLVAMLVLPAAALAGEGPPAAELTFSPAPLDFGKATAGTESATATVTIHNAGTSGVSFDKVKLEGLDAGDFKLSGNNCGWLEPGADCSAWVAFAPGSVGAKSADLVAVPKEAPAVASPISGTAAPAQLVFAPGSHDFGIQRVNRGEGSASLQLTNGGEAMVQLSSIGVGGRDSGNFWTSGGDCWNGRQLQPGESCNVQVGFNPSDAVAYEAELQAYANGGGTFSAALSGFGGRAQLEPVTLPADLGAVTVGAAGPVRTLVFANHGNLPATFFIGFLAGGDAGSFRLLDESCSGAPVAPGASCTAHVRFEPQGAGPKLARIAFFGDDEPAMTALSGIGVAAIATPAPASLDFGEVAAGARSDARSVAVRNDGEAPLELDHVSLAGSDPDQFLIAGDDCGGATLAPGEECQVRVRFAPGEEGAKAATLRLRSPGGSFSVALRGTGAPPAEALAGPDHGEVAAASPHPAPRPWRKRGRQPRFGHGDRVAAASRGRAPRRAGLKARTIPR